jgi:GT2 family glycosyltransferase
MTMTNKPATATIILNWRSPDDTIACVNHVLESKYDNNKIYIFDNESSEESYEILTGSLEGVVILRSPTNLGYAGGNNAAIRQAVTDGADYVWLLNSDAIVAPHTLASLVDYAESHRDGGIVSPIIYETPEKTAVQYAVRTFDKRTGMYHDINEIDKAMEWQNTNKGTGLVVGTSMLISRITIERVGLLDERYFAYWEDMDYSMRAIKCGLATGTDFNSWIIHARKPAITKPHTYYFSARNYFLFARKFFPGTKRLRAILYHLRESFRTLEKIQDHRPQADALILGLWHGLLGITGPHTPRRQPPRPLAALLRTQPSLFRKIVDAL